MIQWNVGGSGVLVSGDRAALLMCAEDRAAPGQPQNAPRVTDTDRIYNLPAFRSERTARVMAVRA